MRIVLLLLLALPAAAEPLGYEAARHLLSRTGFGVTHAEVQALAGLSREEAVDRILAGTRRDATLPPPAFMSEPQRPYARVRDLPVEDRLAWQRRNLEQGFQLREWWLREMLQTPSPLTERMTLFWHSHFATSAQKVRVAHLMYRQNVLLRREALGNFAALLHGITQDPAMLVYLDNAQSRREAPNENFAREVMELFTLGEGRYTEQDIREAARAFTGLSVDRETLEYRWRPMVHDRGSKTVFGKSGRFDGNDVLRLLLERPETAEFIAAKLWRELVSPQPEPKALSHAAKVFRDARYEVKPLVRALLLTEAFWAVDNRGSLIRSPVELVVGTLHTFGIRPATMGPAVYAAAQLGQNVMAPPNVKGWPGGEDWINSATLLGRKQLIERLFRGDDRQVAMDAAMRATPRASSNVMPGATMAEAAMSDAAITDPAMTGAAMKDTANDPIAQAQRAAGNFRRRMERSLATYAVDTRRWSPEGGDPARLLLPVPPVNPPPEASSREDLVRHLVADPAYQLK
jgi:uncharacterized protein (DUF1800 family)